MSESGTSASASVPATVSALSGTAEPGASGAAGAAEEDSGSSAFPGVRRLMISGHLSDKSEVSGKYRE